MIKKIIHQIKSRSTNAIPVVVFLLILTAALNIYFVKNDTTQLKEFEQSSSLQSKEEQWKIIELAINSSYEVAKKNSVILRDGTVESIEHSYKDMSVLEKEFSKGEFSDKFYRTLEQSLSINDEMNPLHPTPYRTSVATREGIIAVFSNERDRSQLTDKQIMSWDAYYRGSVNPSTSEAAIRQIINQSDDIIFIQNSHFKGDETMNEIDFDTLKELYMEKGEKVLKNFSILAPSYIKDNSDIFGNSDNDFMKDNNSKKIIIIQSIKVKDILEKNESSIKVVDDQELLVSTSIDSYISSKFGVAIVWSFLLFAMSLILISIYNSDRARCSECNRKSIRLGGDPKSK